WEYLRPSFHVLLNSETGAIARACACSAAMGCRRHSCTRLASGKRLQSPLQAVEYHINQYELEQGALEIQYIEEYFGEFPRKKTPPEIVDRLKGRSPLILLANAPLADDPGSVVPVSFKVAHEIKSAETEPKLADLVARLRSNVAFDGRR